MHSKKSFSGPGNFLRCIYPFYTSHPGKICRRILFAFILVTGISLASVLINYLNSTVIALNNKGNKKVHKYFLPKDTIKHWPAQPY